MSVDFDYQKKLFYEPKILDISKARSQKKNIATTNQENRKIK